MSPVSPIEPSSQTGFSRLIALAEQVEAAVAAGTQGLAEAPRLRVQSLQAIADLSPERPGVDGLQPAARLAEAVLRAGWVDQPVSADAANGAEAALAQGPQGLLAALLIAPAWQIASLPTFATTPRGLWPALAAASFRIPSALVAPGQIDRVIALHVRATRELAQMLEANPGAAAVRAVLEAFQSAGSAAGLTAAPTARRELRVARAKVRQARVLGRRGAEKLGPLPRDGRRLEVGLVLPALADDRLSREMLSRCGLLDGDRFRLTLFVLGTRDERIESELAAADIAVRPLEGAPALCVDLLRSTMLDVAVFGTRVDDPQDAVSDLVVRRVAPLQVVIDEADGTSGLAAADAAFAAESDAASFVERVLSVPECGWRAVARSGRGPANRTWTKESLGWPAGTVGFSSCAPFALVTPEWADGAARVLAGVPASRLIIYSGTATDAGPLGLAHVCATVLPAMQRHGILAERVLISNEAVAGTAEVAGLLACADVHLDTYPVSDGEGCRLAQSAGVPVVAFAGEPDAWVARAVACSQAPKPPATSAADPMAFGDRIGTALETAHDLLVAGKLRSISVPAVSAGDYRALILSGKARRAERALRLLAEQALAGADVWRLLAMACLHQGQRQAAMAALQQSLRFDSRNSESWALLEQLAVGGGHSDLLKEIEAYRATLPGGSSPLTIIAPTLDFVRS